MIPLLDTYDWENAFGEDNIKLRYELVLCDRDANTLSTDGPKREDVEEIYYSSEGENDGPAWLAVGRLRDGRYFSLEANCDYTGWDCQAGGAMSFSSTKEGLFKFGVTDEGRSRFGIDIYGNKLEVTQ